MSELMTYRHPDGRSARIRPGNPTSHDSLVAQGFEPPEGDRATAVAGELIAIKGLGEELVQALSQRGIVTLADLRETSDGALLAVPGIGERKLALIRGQL